MPLLPVSSSNRISGQCRYVCPASALPLGVRSGKNPLLSKARRLPDRLLFGMWQPCSKCAERYGDVLGSSRPAHRLGCIQNLCAPSSGFSGGVGAGIRRLRSPGRWPRKSGVTQAVVVAAGCPFGCALSVPSMSAIYRRRKNGPAVRGHFHSAGAEFDQAAFLAAVLVVVLTAFTVALVAAATLASASSVACLAALLKLS